MKKLVGLWIMLGLILSAALMSCGENQPGDKAVPPLNTGTKSVMIEVGSSDFEKQPRLVQNTEVVYPSSVVVSLVSNASTGFSWTGNANISDQSVLTQFEHNYVAPEASGIVIVGAAGKEVWTFKPMKLGTSTITMEYSQPWTGGQKAVWTYQVNVTVK